ncbi:ABC transporter permease [Pseudactinotalea suaedae]|uniref:ABC transporter permease n=1 Tax=Pseudactinotalea suaedae TaxID=1524924 RepID=UPI0012E2D9A3|nr:ABC transporter permease subunit [Pseudactinotalea suaedae]
MSWLPHIPLGVGARAVVDWINTYLPDQLDWIAARFNDSAGGLTTFFLLFHPLLVAAVLGLLAAWVRSIWFGIFVTAGLVLTMSLGLWTQTMQTLSMVVVATVIALVIGIPIGILAARSSVVSTIVRPVLDFLQTIPALVYLVPVVIFFSIGFAPGVVATIVFAIAPGVRLTELAIRQVDAETVEAGEAFGGTPWQILRGIQLPLGLPTIMAGVNQVIMLALSMVVMAGFVGAPGLGKTVTGAFSRIDVAVGFEAGLAIVILAIFLDRLTGAFGQPTPHSLGAKVRGRRQAAAQAAVAAQAADQQVDQATRGARPARSHA